MRWLWITCWWSKKNSFFQFNDFFVWWFSSMVCAVEWNCGSYNASTERGTAWLSVQGQIPPSKRCCSRWCHCKGHRARHGGSFAAALFFFFLRLNFVLNLSWILMVSEFDCSSLRRTVRLSRSLSCGLFTFLLIPPHLSLKDLKKDLLPGHSHKKMGITIIHHLTM